MDGIMDHPFLDTRFEIPWSQLTPDRVKSDITKAIADAKAQVDAIAALPLGSLTYENTFAALEQTTERFNAIWNRVSHLKSVADSPAMRAAYNEMLPAVTAFVASIPLNTELWKRLKAFTETPFAGEREPIKNRLISETLADFRQQGADLPADKRARMAELEGELAQATQKFSENVLDATNAFQLVVTDEARLDGLPDRAKKAARASAEAKGLSSDANPAWRFTVHLPSVDPVLTYANDASLRRELFEAQNAVGAQAPSDNTPVIPKILALRDEKAALLGKAHFPDLILARRMAGSGGRALAFVNDLQRKTKPAFDRECVALERFAGITQKDEHLAPWDVAYQAEKMRKKLHDFDEEALRPYFPADRVFAGLFEICKRIHGITVTERETGTGAGKVEVWHEDVKFYDVRDANGTHIGSFYSDWYPRESKRAGAWMDALFTGGPRADGTWAPHLGLICGNMTPPVGGKPALLNHREVETIFHEFGHLMHHLFGAVPVKTLNGTNVAWDFVELPSQIMENWTWEREGLDLFARHYETGEKIPDELFKRMMSARNFRAACKQMRQLSFGTMDLLLHVSAGEFKRASDVEPGIRRLTSDCLIPTTPPARTHVNRFNHLFSSPVGYAAGYYSYKWAEVLDADAFTRFQKEGIFNAATGKAFRECVLSKGNSENAAKLYRDFMGRDPSIDALMKRQGLAG